MQYFPKYCQEGSKLERFILNDSLVKFENIPDNYKKLRHLSYLDLSFNKIDSIPSEFKLFENLKQTYFLIIEN